jgi:hypothetical protein
MPGLEATIEAIDAANASDPRLDDGAPFEMVYARRMSACLDVLYPEASELLKIATRAQHLRRWEISRSDYPEGRVGYNDWRRACRTHHARLAADIMRAQGHDEDAIQRVGRLIRKEQLKKDAESQALENVAAVVFLEYYFDDFLKKHAGYADEKIVDILGKTLCKMSQRGHAAALALSLDERARMLVAAALAREAVNLERLAALAPDA